MRLPIAPRLLTLIALTPQIGLAEEAQPAPSEEVTAPPERLEQPVAAGGTAASGEATKAPTETASAAAPSQSAADSAAPQDGTPSEASPAAASASAAPVSAPPASAAPAPAASNSAPAPAARPTAQAVPPTPPEGELAPEDPEIKKPKALQFALTWDVLFPIQMPLPAGAGTMAGIGYQGFSLDVRYWVRDQIAIGGLVGWHSVNNKTTVSFEDNQGVTQTGSAYVEASTNEVLGRVHYAMADRAAVRAYAPPEGEKADLGKQVIPMIALGIGAGRLTQSLDTGISRTSSERWTGVIAPEVGLEIPTRMLPILVAGRLHYFFGSDTGPDQLYGTLSLGGAFE